jgi:transposase-like protein
MNTNTFEFLLARFPGLSHKQIRYLLRYISSLKTDKMRVMEKINSKDARTVCPKCCSSHHYKWGKSKDLQRLRCRDCQITYTFLSGTPLSCLRHRSRRLNYVNELIQGSTIRRSAKVCGIDPTTSFRWRHRFIQMLNDAEESHLKGIVEIDETFFWSQKKVIDNLIVSHAKEEEQPLNVAGVRSIEQLLLG